MSEGNGRTEDMSQPLIPSSEYVDFIIGQTSIRIRVLTLWDLDIVKTQIQNIGADHWVEYAKQIIEIISLLEPSRSQEEMMKACSAGEARDLINQFQELLIKSGFLRLGELQAATESLGTGTSTPSPPSLPSAESAGETPSESKSDLPSVGTTS